ncbi:MAG: ribosome biogenesis GTPase YlqF [Candidatus Paralactobacillus gallistercoris]|uniref:Ribosome biogenesis GTPase A n=1 Tax=Candidatus Paralactobacillus gallistercoris TaxID=2838724 RepID=A0A948X1H4_9LACO|nr:ribosome biogenesis GTPase YlqF [Candidatus Paralactobacillus gallistercoris]
MVNIQWYPGHMAKAKRQVQEKLKQVDAVFEIVDARVPLSSRNPMLDEVTKQKPRLIILNKADLAEPNKTKQWIKYYQQQGYAAVAIDAQHHANLPQIAKQARILLADKIAKQQAKGIKQPTVKAMCIGIPNVGKSTVLNRLMHKNIAITGNKPGVTKNQQWLKTKDGLALLDTPGILWPKFEDPEVGLKLSLTGAISDAVYHEDDVALFLLTFAHQFYPTALNKFYHLTDEDFNQSMGDLLLQMTKHAGMKDDYDRFARKMILDYRKGLLGKITLDLVPQQVDDDNE